MDKDKKVLVSVKHLKQYFSQGKKSEVKAIDDVSFEIYEGETFGLVGESGSGKSTTGRSIIRLYNPTDGEILFDGRDISKIKNHSREMKAFRKEIQMIFQDPYASLNPRMKVKDIIAEGLHIHHLVKNDAECDARVNELLELVGLNKDHATRYPYEFSGGQRQRIGIARALYHEADVLIFDEATSALDGITEKIIMDAIHDFSGKKTIIMIAHRLKTVRKCDVIFMMEQGKIVDQGTYQHLLETNPKFKEMAEHA